MEVGIWSYRTGDEKAIAHLVEQLDQERPALTSGDLRQLWRNDEALVMVARDPAQDGRIVGIFIGLQQNLLGRLLISLHDFIVDEPLRASGIAPKLIAAMHAAIQTISDARGTTLHAYASANPRRGASNALMRKSGMTLVSQAVGENGTNFYKKTFTPRT